MSVKVREKPKGSGVYWIFIDHLGKRKSKKVGRDKRMVQEIAKKIEAKLILGQFGLDTEEQRPKPSFFEYAEYWLETYVKALRRISTYERYKDILKLHVYPDLGRVPIDQIKRSDIRNLILKKSMAGVSRSTIALISVVISCLLGYAVEEELIPVNPGLGILKRLRLERRKRITIEPLTPQEVQVFLDTCFKHFRDFYEFFLCAFRSGMRLGELLALAWKDIDWSHRFIRVRRSFRRGRFDGPKTDRDRRVDMSDQLVEALQGLLKARKRQALKEGTGGEPPMTIFHRQGRPMNQEYVRLLFKHILKRAGIRQIRFHDIRHTYASQLLSQGLSPVYIKEQLGHHSIQITVDIYGHLIPNSNQGAVNLLDSPRPSATYPQPV
jgi:integrase